MHGLKSVCTRGGIQWSKPAVFACRQVSVYVICVLSSDVSRSDKEYHSLPHLPFLKTSPPKATKIACSLSGNKTTEIVSFHPLLSF